MEAELAKEPGGKQQQGEGLLGFVAEQCPTSGSGDSPHQDGCGPVFLDVEYLAGEGDGGAGRDGSDSMECSGEAMVTLPRPGRGDVEERDHGDDGCEARTGSHLVPMSGDEEDNAAAEQHGAEDERNQALPAQAGGIRCKQ